MFQWIIQNRIEYSMVEILRDFLNVTIRFSPKCLWLRWSRHSLLSPLSSLPFSLSITLSLPLPFFNKGVSSQWWWASSGEYLSWAPSSTCPSSVQWVFTSTNIHRKICFVLLMLCFNFIFFCHKSHCPHTSWDDCVSSQQSVQKLQECIALEMFMFGGSLFLVPLQLIGWLGLHARYPKTTVLRLSESSATFDFKYEIISSKRKMLTPEFTMLSGSHGHHGLNGVCEWVI